MNRLTIVLAILGFGLAVLVFTDGNSRILGLQKDEFGRFVMLLPFAAMLSVGILASRRSLGESMRQMMIWLLILLALVTAYLYRNDMQAVGDRLLSGLLPGRAMVVSSQDGEQEVILYKAMNGHFQADATVNGQSIGMLVDTGASMIALSHEDAERIGINPENLTYSVTVMTANGIARAAPVTLSEIAIGPIIRRNLPATVAEQGKLDQSLLGMSFLSTLSSLQMQTDELRLRN
ncbi:MAG: aspartic protease [Rhizobium sp. 63-7]|nr:MAG: aspartic protease [Rhizobium sp. 63-7]